MDVPVGYFRPGPDLSVRSHHVDITPAEILFFLSVPTVPYVLSVRIGGFSWDLHAVKMRSHLILDAILFIHLVQIQGDEETNAGNSTSSCYSRSCCNSSTNTAAAVIMAATIIAAPAVIFIIASAAKITAAAIIAGIEAAIMTAAVGVIISATTAVIITAAVVAIIAITAISGSIGHNRCYLGI